MIPKSLKGKLVAGLTGIILFAALALVYVNLAFPKTRCKAVDHLEPTQETSDCYSCHFKSTPKVAQDWYESKHGVMLVKCVVCHGQPDGKGTFAWAVNPSPETVCKKCHDPAIGRMEAKFGLDLNCNQCHPFHNNSLHHDAYELSESQRTLNPPGAAK